MARQHDAEERLSGSAANALRAIHRRFRHALPHHPAWGPRHDAEPANRAAFVSVISLTAENSVPSAHTMRIHDLLLCSGATKARLMQRRRVVCEEAQVCAISAT